MGNPAEETFYHSDTNLWGKKGHLSSLDSLDGHKKLTGAHLLVVCKISVPEVEVVVVFEQDG